MDLDPTLFFPAVDQIKTEVCMNATEYLTLKNDIYSACVTAEWIGVILGLVFGLGIGYMIRVQVEKHGKDEIDE